jgi:hypothetical protein
MRKAIDDGPDRELALHMKSGLEFPLREQESVHAPQAPRFDIDKETRAALAAGEAGISLQFPSRRIAADDRHGIGGIDGLRRISAPVHGLTVVAMAEELHDGFSGDFDLDRPAAALDLVHSFCSVHFGKALVLASGTLVALGRADRTTGGFRASGFSARERG